RIILLLILIPIIIFLIQNYLIIFLLRSGTSSFSVSAQRYMEMQSDLLILSNWKFKLVEGLKLVGIFVPSIYLTYLFWFNKNQHFPKEFQLLMRIILIIVVIASLFLLQVQSAGYGVYITGYRILLMAGIPLCIILSFCYQKKKISLTQLNFLIFFDFLYGELYMLGKIFFSNLKE
ncbi:MAG: hypothetical protein LIO65_10160, partial [Odoribacter sp.]|nr:hypothetical protein [Odoribacter sp.]